MKLPESPHAVIIPGAGVDVRKRVTLPGFEGKLRLLALAELLKKEQPDVIIFSGTTTAGEEYLSEAEALEQYAKTFKKIHTYAEIVLEKYALDTFENLENSVAILSKREMFLGFPPHTITIITNAFHHARVAQLCQELEINARIINAEDLLAQRCRHHANLMNKREKGAEMKVRRLFEKTILLLSKYPFGQKLMKVLAAATRK